MRKCTKLILVVILLLIYTGVLGANLTYAHVTSSTSKKTTVTKKRVMKKTNSRSASSRMLSNSTTGELLDWWTSVSKIFARGDVAMVTDIKTGKTFKVNRTMGTNHADVEALSTADTAIIKSIWGGFSWVRRPVLVKVEGRTIAASMTAMPHAGTDAKPAYETIDNRSAGFGTGMNLDVIKNNGMDGHMDIHFLNSTRHKDGKLDLEHQKNILEAAGK